MAAPYDYQKMEMRGETVDVNRIRQNVKEGMENMKGRMKEWGQEVKDSAQNLSSKAKEFADGNISHWIRHASIVHTPMKKDLTSKK